MNAATIIVLTVIVALAGLAIRSIVKNKKEGNACSSCGGDCGCCHKECSEK
ncbi:FeoB-associated Cys-rich membrane protein [Ihubacter sp. rT4E-8]|uniref:FeoB-associated Cys-rich membrane protein n=1 Tax=Ihubacter sp. rT4E-8 TaxID=3242369 RepID=UPI00137B2B0F